MANVKLSDAELALACNAEWLLTKNTIIQRVYELFGELSIAFVSSVFTKNLPVAITILSAKISRGENYRGLPWVMLDFPRYLTNEHIFSVRTMFWWGRHFSQFFIVKGAYLEEGLLTRLLNSGQGKNWYLCVANTPWEHHFDEENMVAVAHLTIDQAVDFAKGQGFLKLGTKIPIGRWEEAADLLYENYNLFLDCYRGGEKIQ